jgi:hypothetical protein
MKIDTYSDQESTIDLRYKRRPWAQFKLHRVHYFMEEATTDGLSSITDNALVSLK